MRYAALLLALVALVGCAGAQRQIHVVTRYEVVSVPESLYRCPELPLPPFAPDSAAQQLSQRYDLQIADYLLELYGAGAICRKALGDVREFLRKAGEEIEKSNAEY